MCNFVKIDDHGIAVEVAVFHGRAFARDHDARHLDVIEAVNQQVRSPASWLTDTIKRLGRHNALACGFDRRLVENCIRIAARRAVPQ